MWKTIQRASSTTLSVAAIVPAVALFIASMLIVALLFDDTRIDLTDRQIYTLSESTKAALESVEEPITIRAFFSSALTDEFAEVRVYSERVNEVLRAYERLSGGLVTVERIDPVPFSTEEDSAIAYNLFAFPLSRAGEQGYFGLVATNSLDQIETISALAPGNENNLEFDLTRMIVRLSTPQEPIVGVIDGLGLFGSTVLGRGPAAIIQRLGEDFELVQGAFNSTTVREDLDALVIIHPYALSLSTLYAIDQYAIRGGPVLVFLDTAAEHSSPDPTNNAVPEYPDSYLAPLLAAWGAVMVPEQVVGDLNMALEVRGQAGDQVVISDYVAWLKVDENSFNPEDPVTGQLRLMRINTAGALFATDDATTTMTPLIQTTTESMLIEQATILRRFSPDVLLSAFDATDERYTLAARITGPVATAFPDGPPPPPTPQPGADPFPDPLPLISDSVVPVNIIVVSDTDMLTDDLTISADGRQNTQNMDFVINAIDSLAGDAQLLGLRGQGLVFRPFSRVDEFEKAAEDRYRATELELQAELEGLEADLDEIRTQALVGDGPLGALAVAQQDAIDAYNQRIVGVRLDLREVQSALRAEIDSLSTRLELINIAAVPALVIIVGFIVWLLRRARLASYVRRIQKAA